MRWTCRSSRDEFRREGHVSGDEIVWHGETPCNPDWSETSRFLAYTIFGTNNNNTYVAYNTSKDFRKSRFKPFVLGHLPKVVQLPAIEGQEWEAVVDTGSQPPFDIVVPDEELEESQIAAVKALRKSYVDQNIYPMLSYSCIVLISKKKQDSNISATLF